ncbi:unnamed protein product [Linum tenue]|uniref:Dilute domain-containing protein n=1 Tax=Linum tenue TaxID=586396 RepID=A0AAV0PR48_9ROSI|nr:unnamed protein product [Linum tenue]
MAARETGALKEAKDKLEKRVEELTWRLQLEKRLRTDLEESKTQEVAKLQKALNAMQSQVEEAKALVVKEREAAQKAIREAPPAIKETPVVVEDTEKVRSFTARVEMLEGLLNSQRQAAEEAKQACVVAESQKEQLSKKLEDSEKKVDQLQDSVQSLEEKVSNLESENQVLRQQALAISPTAKALALRPKTTIIQDPMLALPSTTESENEDKPQRSLNEKQQAQDNNDVLSYWLSNSTTLLLLLQRTLKATGAASLTPQRRRSTSSSLFGRVSQGFRGSPQSAGFSFLNGRVLGGLEELRQVEAKYPALLFKQQLTAFLEKIYGMIRDNLKKEISPLIGLCIQAPRTSRAGLAKGRSQANAMAQQTLIAHWQSIGRSLDSCLKTMRANYVSGNSYYANEDQFPLFLFMRHELFNVVFPQSLTFSSLLLRRECCSFSNGEYVKTGLAELEQWCHDATEEVIHQKPKKALKEITTDLCPVLSIQQLYRISTMYWDDKYGTHSVSSEVISNMRVMMTEDTNNAVSSSFLLDDDSSIPFTVDDISKSMEHVDVAEIEPPPLIRENSGFSFLQRTD